MGSSAITKTPRAIIGLLIATAMILAGSPGEARRGLSGVVVFERDDAPGAAERALRSAGGRLEQRLEALGGATATVPTTQLARLSSAPGITGVVVDAPVTLSASPLKPKVPPVASTQTTAVDAPRVWSAGYRGKVGVNVAVLDSGISPMPDLTTPTNRIVGWKDFVAGSTAPTDPHGHGTYIAGIIAGNGAASAGRWKGVAPEVGLVGIRVFDALGTSTTSRVVAGIDWAIANRTTYGIRVLNLSLSANPDLSYRFDALAYAAERAWQAGIVVVASAGNQGPLPGTIFSPGLDPYVITVGSVDHRGTTDRADDVMSTSSGAGPTLIDRLAKPDVVAPGEWDVSLRAPLSTFALTHPLSTVDGTYISGAGTSPATGVVSGVVALMLHRRPTLVPDQVKDSLVATVTAAPCSNAMWCGRGYVNAYAATMSKRTTKANAGLTPSVGGGLSSTVSLGDVKMR